MMNKYESFKAYMQKLADVGHSIAVLSWDKEVNLPKGSAASRSQQVATLSGIYHELFTNDEFGENLKELHDELNKIPNPTLEEKKKIKNINVAYTNYKKATLFTEEFVVKKSKITSEAFHAWIEAKKENNFSIFAPKFKALIDIKKEEAETIGYKENIYDALLDEYEPGLTVKKLDVIFTSLRDELIKIIKDLGNKEINNDYLRKYYPKDKQWDFGIKVLENMGYDFKYGRQDISTHPFTTNFSSQDVRITTRIDENDFENMTWSCIHEGGHALYELGLPYGENGLATGSYISLAIHESQSRLWENHVGRSREYWEYLYPQLQEIFTENLSNVSIDDFYKGINVIKTNLIRTEADELHYHLHVIVRYEIEKGIMNGEIDPLKVNEAWNNKYEEYLGIRPDKDSIGVLQDIHWAHGSVGYFPTYSLGSLYAAQFYAQAEKELENLPELLTKGITTPLLDWLRDNIHQHGRLYEAEEICLKLTGEKLNAKYFIEYAKSKFSEIYK